LKQAKNTGRNNESMAWFLSRIDISAGHHQTICSI